METKDVGRSLRSPPALWGHMVPMWGLCHTVHYNLRAEHCDLWHLPAAHAARCHSLDVTVVTVFVPEIFFPSQGKEDLLERKAGRLEAAGAVSQVSLPAGPAVLCLCKDGCNSEGFV